MLRSFNKQTGWGCSHEETEVVLQRRDEAVLARACRAAAAAAGCCCCERRVWVCWLHQRDLSAKFENHSTHGKGGFAL